MLASLFRELPGLYSTMRCIRTRIRPVVPSRRPERTLRSIRLAWFRHHEQPYIAEPRGLA
jgi:hypothetical protein